MECIFRGIKLEGIESLNDLLIEEEFTRDRVSLKNLKVIKNRIPEGLVKIGNNYSDEMNTKLGSLTHFYTGDNTFVPAREITVKTLQNILKIAMGRTELVDYNKKLGISDFDKESIMDIRRSVSNVKLRNTYFRLINKDFFTKDRMFRFRFKMILDNKCERCGGVEDVKHLLWECSETKKMWENYNIVLGEVGLNNFNIKEYNDLYKFNGLGALNTIKLKLINELIQIVRPTQFSVERIKKLIINLRNTEKYIAVKNKLDRKHENRWKDLGKISL
jgi:hypothetical protein